MDSIFKSQDRFFEWLTEPLFKRFLSHYKDPLYRNSYYLMANSMVSSVLGFIFWMVAARFYVPSDVGLAAALMSASGMVIGISRMGLDVSVVRFLSGEEDKRSFINTCLTAVGFSTILVSIAFLLGMDIWAQKLRFVIINPTFITAFIIFTTVGGLSALLTNIFVAYRDAKYSFVQNVIAAALKIPLPIILAPIFGVFGVFGSWGISMTVALFVSISIFLRIVQPGYIPYPVVNRRIAKRMYSFSAGNYLIGIVGSIPTFIIPLMILQVLRAEDIAYYFIAHAIGGNLFIIPGSFSTSLFAEGSFKQEKVIPDMKRAARHSYLLLIPGVILTILIGDKLLLLFGKDYSSSGYMLLSILAFSSICMVPASLYTTYLRVRMRIKELLILTTFSASSLLILSYILIQKTGITGTGIAYLAVHTAISLYAIARLKQVKS